MNARIARSRTLRRLAVAPLALSALALAAGAQVPEGWVVTSNFRSQDTPPPPFVPHPGDGALWMFHPTLPGTRCAISGLAQDLTGGGQTKNMGANAIAVRPSDGALVVGELALANGGDLDVHVITLVGSAVAGDIKYYLGAAGPFGAQVGQLEVLPNEDVLVSTSGVVSGPMAGRHLGVLKTSTGIVTPIPLSPPPPGETNAATVDPAGTTVYFATITSGVLGSFASQVWSVPLAGGAPTQLLATTDAVLNLAYRAPGDAGGNPELVVASLGDLGQPNLLRLDLVGGGTTPIATGLAQGFNGIEHDPFTGELLAVRDDPYTGTGEVVRVGYDGSTTLLWSSTIDGAFGEPAGVAVRAPAATYGLGTPGSSTYGWAIAPNAGGLPLVGNASFSLTVTQTPGTSPGFVFASLAPAGFVAFGILVLVDLGQQIGAPIAVPPNTVPLPIPTGAGLAGLDLYLQAVFADPSTAPNYAATAGLRIALIGSGCP